MAIAAPVLCTREDVTSALDVKSTARNFDQIDAKLESARDVVEAALRRRFTPFVGTRYFDWPKGGTYGPSWRLWLDRDEVVSVSALTSGGTSIAAADYNLEPANSGPPYNRIEIDLSGTAAFTSGDTHQRAIAVTGTFLGCPLTTSPAGALAEDLDTSETGVDVTSSAAATAGVGDLVLCGSEYMLIVGKTMLTTGQTLQTALTAQASNVTVAVTTGSAYTVGEVLLLDSERMLITDISGNNLTVKRAHDGSTLATHSGSTIYAPRTWTVRRGEAGTTAAVHSTAATLTRHVVPALVREYAVAEALSQLLGQSTGWARPAGTGNSTRPQPGSVGELADKAAARWRRARLAAV